jgi:AcrR family transcriptional regulator
MKIGDLSKISGVSRYSIHHYLRIGLLPPPQRKNQTMAYYGDEHIMSLKKIASLRDEGFSLYVIHQVLSQKSVDDNLPHTNKKTMASQQSKRTKESKRQEIIKAAGKVFSEKGYYQTNISDITDELGIGKSTFYLHFKNKKEVFFECIDYIFENLWKEDFVRIREETDMRSRLRMRGEAFIRVYPRIKDILQLVRGASVGKEEGIERKYNEIYAKLVRPVISDLKKGMEQGVFPKVDPELMAYIITGSSEAIAYRIHLDNKYTIEDGLKIIRQFSFRG